jgi:hypothetical protein
LNNTRRRQALSLKRGLSSSSLGNTNEWRFFSLSGRLCIPGVSSRSRFANRLLFGCVSYPQRDRLPNSVLSYTLFTAFLTAFSTFFAAFFLALSFAISKYLGVLLVPQLEIVQGVAFSMFSSSD